MGQEALQVPRQWGGAHNHLTDKQGETQEEYDLSVLFFWA